jgi:hypothetical protein
MRLDRRHRLGSQLCDSTQANSNDKRQSSKLTRDSVHDSSYVQLWDCGVVGLFHRRPAASADSAEDSAKAAAHHTPFFFLEENQEPLEIDGVYQPTAARHK